MEEPWRDDFSHARNRSIEEATAKHLLWLDADDRLPTRTQAELRRLRDVLLPKVNDKAFVLRVESRTSTGDCYPFVQVRVFPRRSGVRFQHRIHEQVIPSLRARGIELIGTDWVVEHTGYADAGVTRAKLLRNYALLERSLEDHPDDFGLLIHMAQTLKDLDRHGEALTLLEAAIARMETDEAASAKLISETYVLRAHCRIQLGDRSGAGDDLRRASEIQPDWGIPHVSLAEILMEDGEPEAAWELVQKAQRASFAPGHFAFRLARLERNVDLFAGLILLRRGDREESLPHLERALELDPRDVGLRLELGQALLDSGEYARARRVLEPAGEDEAALPHFVEVASAIGLARVMTGDEAGAGACLAPLLGVFEEHLQGATEAGPMELADAMLRSGYATSARNMLILYQKTFASAA